jgi:hypothetical protein
VSKGKCGAGKAQAQRAVPDYPISSGALLDDGGDYDTADWNENAGYAHGHDLSKNLRPLMNADGHE